MPKKSIPNKTNTTTTNTIAIIGGGNLGQSIAYGLLLSKVYQPQHITVTRRTITALAQLQAQGVQVSTDNAIAVAQAHTIILCVKPYQIAQVLQQIKKKIKPHHVIISVVTGVSLPELQSMIGNTCAIFRAMPNTAIAVQQSMTCISHSNGTAVQVDAVLHLFNSMGKTALIEDALMDAATVLGACGTAFALRYIRANIQGGIEIGFSSATASLIAAQTVLGAAELLLQKNTHPEAEIDKVTTPKGCTIAGLNEMEHQGFSSSLIKGVLTSYHKIVK